MIKVCIVDDHAIMREGLKKMLLDTPGIVVVDEAGSAHELLEKLERPSWDVLLLDMSLPDGSGIELLKEMKKRNVSFPSLVLTMHDEDQYGVRSFKSGAAGFLTKDSAPELLASAIMKVAKGEKYVSTSLAEKLATLVGNSSLDISLDSLSDREFEVISLIGSGKLVTEIANQLSLSVKTVSTYRARIMSKLNLSNNADIIHYCIQNQLINQ